MSLCLPNSRGIVVTQSNSQRRIARIASRVFKQERTNYQTALGQIAKSITPVNNRVGGGILRAKYEILQSYYVLFLFLFCEHDKICRIYKILFSRSRKNLASSGNKIYSKKGGRKNAANKPKSRSRRRTWFRGVDRRRKTNFLWKYLFKDSRTAPTNANRKPKRILT